MPRFLRWSAVVLACCATAVTALIIKREVTIRRSSAPQRIGDWRSYAEHGQRLGPAGAPVTIVVFADYQCPFTKALAHDLRSIQRQMPSVVSLVYRHYPLKSHPQAFNAAAALECAARQGRFREFHELLTSDQTSTLDSASWAAFAADGGIGDRTEFARCMSSPVVAALIEADATAGRRLGVPATPTILVNDRKYAGLPRNLDRIIREVAAEGAQN